MLEIIPKKGTGQLVPETIRRSAAVRSLPFLVPLVALIGVTSCHKAAAPSTAITCTTATGSGSSSTSTCTDPVTNISITISPATASVNVVTTTQFSFSISGGTNSVVTWQVNKITGGNDMVGRIDSNGKYTAPSSPPSPATVTVGVVSFEEPSLSATSAVTIVAAPVVKITSPTPPISVTAGSANTLQFMATVTGGTLNTVSWEVGTIAGAGGPGDATLGTIDANGLYSPPATPPIGSTVFVTAVSNDSSSSFDSVQVKISGYSTSSLQGQFAFSLVGKNASGPFVRAGSFVADGAGHLNAGTEDINPSGAASTPISFAGTYTITTDGRGTLQFNDGLTPATFSFVLANGAELQIIGFDASGTAAGQANAQLASKFNASALRGTYVFDFNGVHGSNAISEIGEFMADGAGHITGGSIDVNDNGTAGSLQITGNTAPAGQPPVYASTYSAIDTSTGRGMLTLATSGPTLHFAFYVVTAGSARFVGLDSLTATGAVAGYSAEQDPNAIFSLASLNGNYAFLLNGSGSGGAYASAGSFAADGHGNITGGVLDENFNSTVNPNLMLSGTSYTLASTGRGTLQLTGARTYVFYLGPTGTAVFQETDANHPNIASDGIFAQQQGAIASASVTTGGSGYAVNDTGTITTGSGNATYTVNTVSGSGAVITFTITSGGTGYSVGAGNRTATSGAQPGSGTGFTVDILTTKFSLASIHGNYAIETANLSTTAEVLTGEIATNGAGGIPSGTIDVNTAGTTHSAVAIASTSSYSTSSSAERGTITLNLGAPLNQARNFAVYVVSPTQTFVVETDSGQPSAGSLLRQF